MYNVSTEKKKKIKLNSYLYFYPGTARLPEAGGEPRNRFAGRRARRHRHHVRHRWLRLLDQAQPLVLAHLQGGRREDGREGGR